MSSKKLFVRKKNKISKELPEFERGSFPNKIRKEIFVQGDLLQSLVQKYIKSNRINFSFLHLKIDKIKRIYVLAGEADYGCAVAGAYNFEVLTDICATARLTSEFNCSNPVLDKNTLVVLLCDKLSNYQTTAAVNRAKECRAQIVLISDYEIDCKFALNTDFANSTPIPIANFTLRYALLAMLALYIGDENHVLTHLYTQIAIKSLQSLSLRIRETLESEYFMKVVSEVLAGDAPIITGSNVDFGCALYCSRLMSFATDGISFARPCATLGDREKCARIIALASSRELFTLLPCDDFDMIRIVPQNCGDLAAHIRYDGTIPLFNPVLLGVHMQLISYHTALKNGLIEEEL